MIYKKTGSIWIGLAVVMALAARSGWAGETASGLEDIDGLRIEVKAQATDAATVESRRSAMLRWWRLMWRSGQDMSRFDEVAVTLLQTAPDSGANFAAVDRGYAVLEEMLNNPVYIEEKRGKEATGRTQATDWPFYGGATLTNSGYSPDPGPSEGRIAWRFPKGHAWDAVPVVEDGRIYLTSPGIDVVGFCLDEKTGEVIWRARQYGEKFYGSPKAKETPVVTGEGIWIKTNRRTSLFNKESGELLRTTGKAPREQPDDSSELAFSTEDRWLFAYDKRDNSIRWRYDTGEPEVRAYTQLSAVHEYDGRLYVGTASCEVHCVDAVTGEKIWTHPVSDWVRSQPVKIGDTVYVATLDSQLHAIKETGSSAEESWTRQLGEHGFTADLVAGDDLIFASGRDLILYAVDPSTGETKWHRGIIDGAWIDGNFIMADYTAALPGTPTIVDGIVYIGGPDGFVNALDVETGGEIWKFEAGAVITGAVSIIDGKAIFGRISSAFDIPQREASPPLFAVDAKTGEPIWTSFEYGNIWIGPILNNEVMFVGDMSGNVYGVDPDTGKKLWEYYTSKDTPQEDRPHDDHRHGWPPGVYCMPVADEANFYTGSWSGYYFAWDQETGDVRWRTQTGNPDDGGGLPDSAAPTLHKDHLYVQKQGYIIAAINIHSGKIDWEWKASPGYLQNGTLAALGDRVYASTARRVTHIPFISWIHCFTDVENGSELLWSHREGGGLTAPVITDDQLIFGSSTGMFLKSIDPQTGDLNWSVFTGGEMTENVPAIYGNKVFSVSKNGWLNAVR